jgi:hypothetical protein
MTPTLQPPNPFEGTAPWSPRSRRTLVMCLFTAFAVACGDYGGGSSNGGAGASSFTGFARTGAGGQPIGAFAETVFPLLNAHCDECHSGNGPGTPAIASADVSVAFDAVMGNQKINLLAPEKSRLVRRLAADFHYCWTECLENGAQMLGAVQAFSDIVSASGGEGETVAGGIASKTQSFADGVEAEGQERFDGGLIALLEFKEGERGFAYDTSGVEPLLEVAVAGIEWMPNYGIRFVEENAWGTATRAQSRKLYDHIADPEEGTQQYSIETWVTPANVSQSGPARIVSYSFNPEMRNFTLGQVLYNYDFRNRTLAPEIDDNGVPSLATADADQDLQANLQHVVVTYDQYRGRRIYVNGQHTGDEDLEEPGRLWNWSPEYNFVIGNEMDRDRPFEGALRLVAIYEYALTEAQITQNFNAGVGKRLLMRFDLSPWAGEGSYIQFVVSELDNYSYLFCEPTVVVSEASGFRISNLRIMVNSQIPVSGQAFINIDTAIIQNQQQISEQCSVITKSLGPDSDIFSIDFEYFAGFENPFPDELFPEPPPPDFDGAEMIPNEGIRDFARANASMAALTGVSATTVDETFRELRQQLPGNTDVMTFSSSQQVAISKLALEYCDTLVEDVDLREQFFGTGVLFDDTPDVAFPDTDSIDAVSEVLSDKMLGVDVATQPGRAEAVPIVSGLIDDLLAICDSEVCGADRTRTAVKGACASVLASAGVTLH